MSLPLALNCVVLFCVDYCVSLHHPCSTLHVVVSQCVMCSCGTFLCVCVHLQDGLVGKILDLLKDIDQQKIIEKLQEHRGVGGDVHRRQLCTIIEEQRCLLADILFSVCCQTALSKNDTILLINYLRQWVFCYSIQAQRSGICTMWTSVVLALVSVLTEIVVHDRSVKSRLFLCATIDTFPLGSKTSLKAVAGVLNVSCHVLE